MNCQVLTYSIFLFYACSSAPIAEGEIIGYLKPKNGKGSVQLQIRKENKVYKNEIMVKTTTTICSIKQTLSYLYRNKKLKQ